MAIANNGIVIEGGHFYPIRAKTLTWLVTFFEIATHITTEILYSLVIAITNNYVITEGWNLVPIRAI